MAAGDRRITSNSDRRVTDTTSGDVRVTDTTSGDVRRTSALNVRITGSTSGDQRLTSDAAAGGSEKNYYSGGNPMNRMGRGFGWAAKQMEDIIDAPVSTK